MSNLSSFPPIAVGGSALEAPAPFEPDLWPEGLRASAT